MSEQQRHYVGFWLRLWASVIDSLLLCIIIFPLLFLVYGKDYLALPSSDIGFWYYLFVWVLPAVAVCLFWFYRDATPGKMVISAKLIDIDSGNKPDYWQLIIRYVGYYISTALLLMGFIWIAIDDRKQGWHDKLASTGVVHNYENKSKAKNKLYISFGAVALFIIICYFALSSLVEAQLTEQHDLTTGQYIAEGFEYGRNVSTTECWNQTLRRISDCNNIRCKFNQSYFLRACMGASYATTQQYD